jgi:hypothetical protein
MLGSSCVAERLAASQEGLRSMVLVKWSSFSFGFQAIIPNVPAISLDTYYYTDICTRLSNFLFVVLLTSSIRICVQSIGISIPLWNLKTLCIWPFPSTTRFMVVRNC